jgi:hypothetical protein
MSFRNTNVPWNCNKVSKKVWYYLYQMMFFWKNLSHLYLFSIYRCFPSDNLLDLLIVPLILVYTVYTKVTKTGTVETKKAITIIVTALFSGESAGARTAVAVAGIPICTDHRSNNKHISIPATRNMWVGEGELSAGVFGSTFSKNKSPFVKGGFRGNVNTDSRKKESR